MNLLPERAVIVKGELYLLTQHEVAIVTVDEKSPLLTVFPLEDDDVVAAYGSLKRVGQPAQLQAGLTVVYFSPRKHHYCRFYNSAHREAPTPL